MADTVLGSYFGGDNHSAFRRVKWESSEERRDAMRYAKM